MTDALKVAVDRARALGLTGLVCGTCESLDGYLYGSNCPACNGTGYPSAAEVVARILLHSATLATAWSAEWNMRDRSVRVIRSRGVRAEGHGHDGTMEGLAEAMLQCYMSGPPTERPDPCQLIKLVTELRRKLQLMPVDRSEDNHG